MITVKGQADIDRFIIGHIIDPSAPNVEFKNITFDCKTIKDASGHIFVRQIAADFLQLRREERAMRELIIQAMEEARLRLIESNVDLSNYSYKITRDTFAKLVDELGPWVRVPMSSNGQPKLRLFDILVEIVDDAVELSPKGESHG